MLLLHLALLSQVNAGVKEVDIRTMQSGRMMRFQYKTNTYHPAPNSIRIDQAANSWKWDDTGLAAGYAISAPNVSIRIKNSAGTTMGTQPTFPASWTSFTDGIYTARANMTSFFVLTGYPSGNYKLVWTGNDAGTYNAHTLYEFSWNGTTATEINVPDKRKLTVTATYQSGLGSDYLQPNGKQLWGLFVNGNYDNMFGSVDLGVGQSHTFTTYVDITDTTTTISTAPVNYRETINEYGELEGYDIPDEDGVANFASDTVVVGAGHAVSGSSSDITSVSGQTYWQVPTTSQNPSRPSVIGATPTGPAVPVTTTGNAGADAVQAAIAASTASMNQQNALNDSKIAQLTAAGFDKVVAAINGSGGGGGGTDVTGVISAINQASLERKNRDDETDALALAWETRAEVEGATAAAAIMADAEARAYVAKTNASQVFAEYPVHEVDNPYSGWMDAYAPKTHHMLFGVRFDNPFYGTGTWGPVFLKAITWIREILIWGIVVVFWTKSYSLITESIIKAVNTPAVSSNAAIIVSNAGGAIPVAGGLAGLATKVAIAVIVATTIAAIPVTFMALVETSFAPMSAIWNLLINPLKAPLDAALSGGNPTPSGPHPIGQAIWYANKIAPIQMMVAVPIYTIILHKVVFPARMFLTLIAMFAKGL